MPSDNDRHRRGSADLTVIGNGMVALAIALEFRRRRPDARILMIGPDTRPGAASPASAAMLAAYSELQTGDLDRPARLARFELARRSVERWPRWIDGIARSARVATPEVRRGTVVIGREDDSSLATIEEAARAHDVTAVRMDPGSIPGFHPRIVERRRIAVRIDAESSIDPLAALATLDRSSIEAGIERLDDRVVALEPGSVALASSTRVPVADVVIANGAFAGDLLATRPEIARTAPQIRFGVGVAIRARLHRGIRVPDCVVRTTNRPGGHGTYFVPHGPSTCYVGATNDVSSRPRDFPRVEELRALMESAMDEFSIDLGDAECRPVIGHRPLTGDGDPMLGMLGPSTWIASGTGRDGFTCAPEIATLMVDSLLANEDLFPSELRPRRIDLESRGVYSPA